MSVSARAGRRRQEGAEKVRGATRFTADLEFAGLLHVRLVLAHAASARIGRIDTSAAKAAPGVVDVVTGADLPELEVAGPELPLAVDRVFFAGQPVVAVVAESEAAAIDAASLVEVDLEETAPVVDAAAAMRDQSPLVLEEDETASEEDASIHGASASAEETPVDRPRNVTGVPHLRRTRCAWCRCRSAAASAARSSCSSRCWPCSRSVSAAPSAWPSTARTSSSSAGPRRRRASRSSSEPS